MFSEFAEVSAATWGVIVALLLVGIIVFAVSKDKKRWTARMLANGALSLPALERQIDDFIAARRASQKPAGPPAAVGAP